MIVSVILLFGVHEDAPSARIHLPFSGYVGGKHASDMLERAVKGITDA